MSNLKKLLKTKKNNRGRDHKQINQDQKPKMHRPIPLKLTEIILRRLLVMYFNKLIPQNLPFTTTHPQPDPVA